MMRIPFNPAASAVQHFQVLIPGRELLELRLAWNERASAWFIDVSSGGRTIHGLRLAGNWPLMYEHRALSPISGDIVALPASKDAPDRIGYGDLGKSWGLYWIGPEDIGKWEAAYGMG